MEKTTGLENLPYEAIEHIARYLSVQDIIACCATCSLMRYSFSGDSVWKRNCDLGLVDYLNKSESLVEPNFELSEVMDDELSTLPPLSTWRKNYMMQIRLFQNWREGRYNKEQIEFGSIGIYESTKVRFFENDYIFLHTKHITERREQNEIWSVSDTHFLHSTFTLHFNEYMRRGQFICIDRYEIVGNKLMVSMGNLILTYDIGLSSFSSIPLCYAFLFDFSEEDSENLVSRARVEPEFHIIIKYATKSILCNNFFVGVVPSEPKIHIWDIHTSKKVTEEISPINNASSVSLVDPDIKTNNFIIKFTSFGGKYRYHYFGYNLTKKEFTSFKLKHNYCDLMILSGNFAIGTNPQQLFSYDYKTSEKLAVRPCNYHILKKSVILVGNNLLCGTSDSTIFVMNPLTLNIINSVKLSFTLYSLKSICNRFVMVNSINTEVWEIGKTVKQLFKFPCDGSFVAVNQHCTKIAIEKQNKIFILTFW